MAREIPKAQAVHTTKYQNFRGVDYTNDATNIWYRRSPTGVNMISDEAGRPFKRTGWAEVVGKDNFVETWEDATGETFPSYTDFRINMCYYFTLAGDSHIIVFTTFGVFKYVNNELSLLFADDSHTYEQLLIDSYHRGFFFEGGGTSAFYIYGQPRIVWKYYYDQANDEYKFEITEPTIPTVIATANPEGAGETLYPFNLLGGLARIEYQTNNYSGDWSTKRVDLPTNVAQQAVIDGDVKVWTSTTTQFDTPIEVLDEDHAGDLATGKCVLYTNPSPDGKAYIAFYDQINPWNGREDNLRVEYPSSVIRFEDHTWNSHTLSPAEPADVVLEHD